MKQHTFERYYEADWQALENWLEYLDKRKRGVEKSRVTEFPQLYRQVCQHLALARDRHYTPHLIERLNRLVLRGHQHLYSARSGLFARILAFFSAEFPQRVRQDWRFVSAAGILFFGSFAIIFISIQIEPFLIYTLLDTDSISGLEMMYHPESQRFGRDRAADSDFIMFGYYIHHNITIDFQVFASGILCCFGTLFFLLFNGIFIGCVAGHLTQIGYTVPFYSFVAGHSALELIAIVLAGTAGLQLGMALIAPGQYSRLYALQQAAKRGISLMYGVITMSVLAAFVEAFWSSNGAIAPEIKYAVGAILWVIVLGYLLGAGRSHAA